MAIGIRFYRDRKLKGLEDSLETEEFTLFLNNMFDALNRKFPVEGIKKHSKDLEVIYVFLRFCCVCIGHELRYLNLWY